MASLPRPIAIALETAALTGLVVAIGFLGHEYDPWFLGLDLHPLWLVVLVITVRYGSPAGPAAALVMAALHLRAFAVTGDDPSELLQLDSGRLVQPLLYVVVAVVVGGTVTSLRARGEFFRRRLDDSQRLIERERAKRLELTEAYRRLEQVAAAGTGTMGALIDAADLLEDDDPDAICDGLAAVLGLVLGVHRVGFWTQNEQEQWVTTAGTSRADLHRPLPPLGRSALQQGGVVTAQSQPGISGPPEETGLMAGLMAGIARPRLVVVVLDMDFINYHEAGVDLFAKLLDWATGRLRTADRIRRLEQMVDSRPQRDLVSDRTFLARLEAELILAAQRQAPCSVLLCRVPGPIRLRTRFRLVLVLRRMITHLLGPNDLASIDSRNDDADLWILLTETDRERAEGVRALVDGAVERFHFHPYPDGRELQLQWAITVTEASDDATSVRRRLTAILEAAP